MSAAGWTISSMISLTMVATTTQQDTEEFRVTMLLLAGTGMGISACISSFQKHEKRGVIVARSIIALVGGLAVPMLIDYFVPWNLSALPWAVLPFFGFMAAVVCFYPGFAWMKRTSANEDATAKTLDDMGRRKIGLPPTEPTEDQDGN